MTNQEFSDSLTTMLNSYNTVANFGEQASKFEIVLDEYEKSVILTQAQDIVVKSFFDSRLNNAGEGFDDSTRRQVDFSTLIKVASLEPTTGANLYDERGKLFKLPRRNVGTDKDTTDVLLILNEKLIVEKTISAGTAKTWILSTDPEKVYYSEPVLNHTDKSQWYTINEEPEKYYSAPQKTEHPGTSGFYTINEESTHYATKPEVVYHEGFSTYHTINDSTQKYYGDKPVKTKLFKSIEHYTINSDTTVYDVKPDVVMDSATYYTINDGTTQYDSAEIISHTDAVPEYWTIDTDTTQFYEDPTDLLTYVEKSSFWTINGRTERYLIEPVIEQHTAYEYWTVAVGETSKIYLSNPDVYSRRRSDGASSVYYDEYYISSDDYGDEGPFDTLPVKTPYSQALDYWTISQDTNEERYFVRPIVTETTLQAAHWTYSGKDYYTESKPTVNHTAGVDATWTILVNEGEASEDTIVYNIDPKIIPHGGTYSVKVGEETVVSGLTVEPTINTIVESIPYYVVNVTGDTEYDTEPMINTIEGEESYSTVNSTPPNPNRYATSPEIHEHPGSDTTWTVSVNDNVYSSDPTVNSHTDPTLDYWTINNEPEHYSEKPTFDVMGGTAPTKARSEYVIVPISYKEYDREMSKAYAQPLKKQAWRLFQNSSIGFDFDSELIPRHDVQEIIHDSQFPGYTVGDVTLTYKIRYIRRPRPIILEDLPNGLEIDGVSTYSTCELNPIMHMDILNKAVELALATRGRMPAPQEETRRQ